MKEVIARKRDAHKEMCKSGTEENKQNRAVRKIEGKSGKSTWKEL